jgi:hypothetical protein
MVSVFYFKLQCYVPDTILYYITIQYFIFFVVFCFLYHTQTQNVGGDMDSVGMLGHGGGGGNV